MTQVNSFVSTILFSLLLSLLPSSVNASGSWSAVVSGLTLAVPGRVYESVKLVPVGVGMLDGTKTTRIYWQFKIPVGRSVAGWLCRSSQCLALEQQRGWLDTFSGLKSNEPLYFKFSLKQGDLQRLVIEEMQVVVNYH